MTAEPTRQPETEPDLANPQFDVHTTAGKLAEKEHRLDDHDRRRRQQRGRGGGQPALRAVF